MRKKKRWIKYRCDECGPPCKLKVYFDGNYAMYTGGEGEKLRCPQNELEDTEAIWKEVKRKI